MSLELEKAKASRQMTYVLDGRNQESAPGLTLENTNTLPTKKVLFHSRTQVQNGLNGINGLTKQRARGVRSNEDVEIVRLQRREDLQLIAKRYASCTRRDSAKRVTQIVQ